MNFFALEGPTEISIGDLPYSDRAYESYHGVARVRFHTPRMSCACRRGSIVPYYGVATSSVTVPTDMRTADWPSLDGFRVNVGNPRMHGAAATRYPHSAEAHGSDGALRMSEWRTWCERFTALASSGMQPQVLRPQMPLNPISFRRSSKQPFSFLFPHQRVVGVQVVSRAIRSVIEALGVEGVEFAEFDEVSDAFAMHVFLEAPLAGKRVCPDCSAVLVDTKSAVPLLSRPLNVDVQHAIGFGRLVFSARVHRAIRAICEASLVPPLFREVELGVS